MYRGKRGRSYPVENSYSSIYSNMVTRCSKSEFPIATVCRACGERRDQVSLNHAEDRLNLPSLPIFFVPHGPVTMDGVPVGAEVSALSSFLVLLRNQK